MSPKMPSKIQSIFFFRSLVVLFLVNISLPEMAKRLHCVCSRAPFANLPPVTFYCVAGCSILVSAARRRYYQHFNRTKNHFLQMSFFSREKKTTTMSRVHSTMGFPFQWKRFSDESNDDTYGAFHLTHLPIFHVELLMGSLIFFFLSLQLKGRQRGIYAEWNQGSYDGINYFCLMTHFMADNVKGVSSHLFLFFTFSYQRYQGSIFIIAICCTIITNVERQVMK